MLAGVCYSNHPGRCQDWKQELYRCYLIDTCHRINQEHKENNKKVPLEISTFHSKFCTCVLAGRRSNEDSPLFLQTSDQEEIYFNSINVV